MCSVQVSSSKSVYRNYTLLIPQLAESLHVHLFVMLHNIIMHIQVSFSLVLIKTCSIYLTNHIVENVP